MFFWFSLNLTAQENQNIETAKLESGNYEVYKAIENSFRKATKTWPIKFFKEGGKCSKILVKRVGLIEEFYDADLPNYPAYYLTNTTDVVVTVISGKIYYYTWSEKHGSTIKYMFSMSKISDVKKESETLNQYRWNIKKKQTGSRDERKKDSAELNAKIASENSLKGKSIKSIKVKLVNKVADAGHFSVIAIGMEVTLTNGEILKSKNLGGKTPYEDFGFSVSGGNFAGGDFKVANDTRQIPGDVITVKAWSKFDASVKGSFSHPLNYRNDISYNYGGAGGRGGSNYARQLPYGGNGGDGKSVNVTAEKLTINGENVTKITIRELSGKVLSVAKIHIDNTVNLSVKGGNGGRGAQGNFEGDNGANGGDGGDAGSVNVTGSGSSQINMVVNVQGGSAGAGGKGHDSWNYNGTNGSRGRSGSSNK